MLPDDTQQPAPATSEPNTDTTPSTPEPTDTLEPTTDIPIANQSNTVESQESEEPEDSEQGLLDFKQKDFSDTVAEEKRTALKTSTGKQRGGTGRNWYVIHTYSGYEDAVEKALRQRIESLNMQDLIFDVIVPKEKTITIKKGEHVTEKKRLFPGYVLVEMIVTDESWYVVRNTPNVTGFVGSGTIPVPVLPEEFDIIRKHLKEEEPKFRITLNKGDHVIIKDGPFKGYDGLVDGVDSKKGKVKVLITIFDRETPVELDFIQVEVKK